MSTAAVINPMEFLKAAATDGAVLLLAVETGRRCVAEPIDVDRSNGDCGFAVVKWLETPEGAAPAPGATVRIEALLHGTVHTFAGTIRDVTDSRMLVTRPYYIGRVQRRSWVRIGADMKAWARLRIGDETRVRPLRDVSAGGLGILLQERDSDIMVGTVFPRVEFALDHLVFIQRGVARRIEPRDTFRRCGIELVGMPESERQRLVRWVMERERAIILGRAGHAREAR